MTNTTAPSISIAKKDQVTSTSEGKITGPSWNPTQGWDRKQQIEEERIKEQAAYQERLALQDPLQMRLLKIEMAIAALQEEVKGLRNA